MHSYNNNNIMSKLIIIKPKYNVIHFIKNNSYFNKIVGYNNIKIKENYK